MSGMKLDKDKCASCEACVPSCPYTAITMEDGYPVFGDACTLCGACTDVCPAGALEKPAAASPAVDKKAYSGIWVFAETRNGSLVRVVHELLGTGRRLAAENGEKLCAVLLGQGCENLVDQLIAHGADTVFIADHPALAQFRDEPYTNILAAAVEEHKPSTILMGATSTGRSLAPRLAARLKTGLTADCTELAMDTATGDLLQTRPAFGGNIMATIVCPRHRPQMATVRPGVLAKAEPDTSRSGDVVHLTIDPSFLNARTEVLEFIPEEDAESVNLEEARIIVAGGRGLGTAENFALVKELANLLGGAVGATRAAVDEGWISYAHQIGQTGKTVSPKVYIACGISGAVQHLVGMQSSDVIVAIGNNPEAPIFKIATYGLVGDVSQILRELINQIKAK